MEELRKWMEQNKVSNSDLAERLGLSYNYIYLIVNGQRDITDTFRWRFAQAYGYDEATRLFTQPTEVTA